MNNIIVTGTKLPIDAIYSIEVDEYIPLRFRSYSEGIGASYYRLGDYSENLMEIIVDPNSTALRGITLTTFQNYSSWPEIGKGQIVKGLPILAANWDKGRIFDINRNFFVSLRKRELLIGWSSLDKLTQIIEFNSIRFLVHDQELIGILILALKDIDYTMLLSYPKKVT